MNYTAFFPTNTLGRVTPIQQNRPHASQRILLPSNLYGLAADTAATGTNTADNVKKAEKVAKGLKKLAEGLKKLSNKIGLGGSDQTRFINRYYQIKDLMNAAGYGVDNSIFSKWLDTYDIRKTDVKNNQKQEYWYKAFQRLRKFTIEWLNYKNPGLGTDFGNLFPDWKMASEGQIHGEPITALKTIVSTFSPGSYTPGILEQAISNLPVMPDGVATDDNSPILQKLSSGLTVVRDATGTIKEIRDTAGQIIKPGTAEYDAAANDAQNTPIKAGINPYLVGGIGILIIGGLAMAGKSNDKKQ